MMLLDLTADLPSNDLPSEPEFAEAVECSADNDCSTLSRVASRESFEGGPESATAKLDDCNRRIAFLRMHVCPLERFRSSMQSAVIDFKAIMEVNSSFTKLSIVVADRP